MVKQEHRKISTSGKGLTILGGENNSNEASKMPYYFCEVINELRAGKQNFIIADKSERHYINIILSEVKGKQPEEIWNGLSLQEQKVIRSIGKEKTAAYLGYRRAYKDGFKRKYAEEKPILPC